MVTSKMHFSRVISSNGSRVYVLLSLRAVSVNFLLIITISVGRAASVIIEWA